MRHVSSYKEQAMDDGGLVIHKDAAQLRVPAQPHHVDRCMEPTSRTYRVHILESPVLGSATSSTANGQSLRAIKRARLCGRPTVDLLPFTALSPQLGRHVVDKHHGQGWHHDTVLSTTISTTSRLTALYLHMLQVVTTVQSQLSAPALHFPLSPQPGPIHLTNPPSTTV